MAKRNVPPAPHRVDELEVRRLAAVIEKQCGGKLENLLVAERIAQAEPLDDVVAREMAKLEAMAEVSIARRKAEREWVLAQPEVTQFPTSRVRPSDVRKAIADEFQKILNKHPDMEPRKAWQSAMAEVA